MKAQSSIKLLEVMWRLGKSLTLSGLVGPAGFTVHRAKASHSTKSGAHG